MNNESENIRLLLNGNKAKEIKAWLLKDMLFELRFHRWKIGLWKSWPFVTAINNMHKENK